MSSNRHSDVARLTQPPREVEGSGPPDRLGGLDVFLDKAMDLENEADQGVFKTDPDEKLMEEDTDELLDFKDIFAISKSCVKPEPKKMDMVQIPLETAQEFGVEEPVLFENRTPGTSDVLSLISSSEGGNKKYKVFVCPGMMDCVKLCKTFIGQGTSVCMNFNCLKNHRQKKDMNIVEGQLFVQKSKDIVFAKPTLDE